MPLILPPNKPLVVPFFLTPINECSASETTSPKRRAENSLSPMRLPRAGDSENLDWKAKVVRTGPPGSEVLVMVMSKVKVSPPISPGCRARRPPSPLGSSSSRRHSSTDLFALHACQSSKGMPFSSKLAKVAVMEASCRGGGPKMFRGRPPRDSRFK